MPLHVSSTIVLIWYHHTETSEWFKITKIQFYKYEILLLCILFIELYFINIRPLTCFSLMIPDAV